MYTAHKRMRNGFTLIEMVVVLACVTVLSAIIAPNVLASFESSKLKSDIQSTMIIQNALELYIMETGKKPSVSTANGLIAELKNKDYIRAMTVNPQLKGAKWSYNTADCKLLLDLSGCGSIIQNAVSNLSSQELIYITGLAK